MKRHQIYLLIYLRRQIYQQVYYKYKRHLYTSEQIRIKRVSLMETGRSESTHSTCGNLAVRFYETRLSLKSCLSENELGLEGFSYLEDPTLKNLVLKSWIILRNLRGRRCKLVAEKVWFNPPVSFTLPTLTFLKSRLGQSASSCA